MVRGENQRSGRKIRSSRVSNRPGTPALSQQTVNVYANSQLKVSKRNSSSNISTSRNVQRSSSRSTTGKVTRKKRQGMRQGSGGGGNSVRLRNRKLGNRKIGRENPSLGAPNVPHILDSHRNKGLGSGANSKNKITSRNSSRVSASDSNKKRNALSNRRKVIRRKSRPASADSRDDVTAKKERSVHEKIGTSHTGHKNILRPASASAATLQKDSEGNVDSINVVARAKEGTPGQSSTAGTIAGFIHRFRHGGPTSPEDRRRDNQVQGGGGTSGNQVWWKRGQGTTPSGATDRTRTSSLGTRKALSTGHLGSASTASPQNLSSGIDGPEYGSAKSLARSTTESAARGSGREAVSALRRRQVESPSSASSPTLREVRDEPLSHDEDDDLDRRATELLQQCDAMLTGGMPSNGYVAPENSDHGSKEITTQSEQPSSVAVKSGTTLTEVEARSKSVLANAEKILRQPSSIVEKDEKLTSNLTIKKATTKYSPERPGRSKRKALSRIENLIFETVCQSFAQPPEAPGALFSSRLGRLIQSVTSPTKNADASGENPEKAILQNDSVLAELERRVEVYSAALENAKTNLP